MSLHKYIVFDDNFSLIYTSQNNVNNYYFFITYYNANLKYNRVGKIKFFV